MNSKQAHTSKKAFTLIELLTVIAIIGILAGLLFPTIKSALQKAEIAQAQNDVKNIEAALKAFYTEYGKWPNTWPNAANLNDVSYGAIGSPSSYQPNLNNGYFGNYWLMNVLRAIPDSGSLNCGNGGTLGSLLTTPINSRGIAFLTVPPKSLKVVNPSLDPNNYPDFVDPWGNPYQITVDTSYDGLCKNLAGSAFTIVPTPVYNFSANDPGVVTNNVAVWSFGPLGPYGSHTAKDWITSWQ
jgi:prepilin-type N-terminal cleavage/methylation domain-containing protein